MKLTDRINKKIERSYEECLGNLKGNAVKTFWVQKPRNFGDLLNPILLKYYGLTPVHTSRHSADILCIGSILQNLSEDYPGIILGSGLVGVKAKHFPKANILGVRGKLTRDLLGLGSNTFLGDPGLLISMIFAVQQSKRHVIGLVPHYFDKKDIRLDKIFRKYPNQVRIIDVQRNPKKVIEDISQCEFILSSCLHGLVSADALGIPNAWVYLSGNVTGAGFKFYDYASASGREIHPHLVDGSESLTDLSRICQLPGASHSQIALQLDGIFRETIKLFTKG